MSRLSVACSLERQQAMAAITRPNQGNSNHCVGRSNSDVTFAIPKWLMKVRCCPVRLTNESNE